MTDHQQPAAHDDDTMPAVSITLRNPDGDDNSIDLHHRHLGLERYVLITTGDEGPEVEGSHLDYDGLAQTLAYVLMALMQSDELSDETRFMVTGAVLDED